MHLHLNILNKFQACFEIVDTNISCAVFGKLYFKSCHMIQVVSDNNCFRAQTHLDGWYADSCSKTEILQKEAVRLAYYAVMIEVLIAVTMKCSLETFSDVAEECISSIFREKSKPSKKPFVSSLSLFFSSFKGFIRILFTNFSLVKVKVFSFTYTGHKIFDKT